MRQLLYIGILWMSIVVLVACEQDDYLKYESENASLRFVYTAVGNDSIVYSFALHPGVEEDIVEIPFRLIGLESPVDREVAVQVVKEKTTARENTDFVVDECKLLAGSITGVLKIKVKKTTELDRKDLNMTFWLCGNDEFTAAPINEAFFRVVLTNQLTEPSGWPFGDYSRIKHEFVIKETGVGTDYSQWSGQEKVYWIGVLNKALYEYNKANPNNPLVDEEGRLITFE